MTNLLNEMKENRPLFFKNATAGETYTVYQSFLIVSKPPDEFSNYKHILYFYTGDRLQYVNGNSTSVVEAKSKIDRYYEKFIKDERVVKDNLSFAEYLYYYGGEND